MKGKAEAFASALPFDAITAKRFEDWPDHERGNVALDDRAVSQREPQPETMERRDFAYS